MSAPVVPQRPARSEKTLAPQAGTTDDGPQIPPRPARRFDRSLSREREASARSPLNESPYASMVPIQSAESHGSGQTGSGTQLPRPPSVSSLPMVGQEGSEYASLDSHRKNTTDIKDPVQAPNETKNVASDLPLHAPKASMTPASAKHRIATVTRTDSSKAAVAGVGKPTTEYVEPEQSVRPPSVSHVRTSSAVSTERPGSTHSPYDPEQEQGIPEIGLQVPMNPMAGDVQAPTPGPGSASVSTGVGFFNDASRARTADGRRRSAQGFHGPPGSYGLHGHGLVPNDQFEKKWYQRHPDELAKEESGAYGPALSSDRPEWAMSSDELNQLVHDSSSRLPGMGMCHGCPAVIYVTKISIGTKSTVISTPSEAIGYKVSEQYSSKLNSPRLPPASATKSRFSRPSSQSHAESPLRRTSFASEDVKSGSALESENEDDHIFVKPPPRRADKYGGAGYDPPTADLGPEGGNSEEQGGWIHERGAGTPILASDEIAKNPGAEFMQPAVSPAQPLTEEEYFAAGDSDHALTPSRSRSRNSRPASLHSFSGITKLGHEHEGTGTPLEEIEEYEPLFTDDDDEKKKPKTAVDKLKRPDLERHRFPSKDVWEDTPTSLQLRTTVETPQEPASSTSRQEKKPAAVFEHPDKEQARRGKITEPERADFLSDPSTSFAKPKFAPHLQHDTHGRPGLPQRFPSRDVWEDTPDSLRLETVVGRLDENVNVSTSADGKPPANTATSSQDMASADRSLTSPPERPAVPARPARTKAAGTSQGQPAVPARSSQKSRSVEDEGGVSLETRSKESSPVDRKGPSIPEKPKPHVPPRPARAHNDQSDPTPKAKPAVPARPQAGSSKFASIKAGFMNDLNSRLQIGPKEQPMPQPERKEEEKATLMDARKGRARGPARRKPTVSPSPLSESFTAPAVAPWSISEPLTVWSISDAGSPAVHMPSSHEGPADDATAKSDASTPRELAEHPTASPLSTNTAGEPLQPRSATPKPRAGALAHSASPTRDARARSDEAAAIERLKPFEQERIGQAGDVPEPVVDQPTSLKPGDKAGAAAQPASSASATGAAKDAGALRNPAAAASSAKGDRGEDQEKEEGHVPLEKKMSLAPAESHAPLEKQTSKHTAERDVPLEKKASLPQPASPLSPVATKNAAPVVQTLMGEEAEPGAGAAAEEES